ncbi:MAG: hypothetical protein ABJA57_09130 [Ginsengibacter sp.]
MKKIMFAGAACLFFITASAQRINKIIISNGGGPAVISYLVDDVITLNISMDGKIIDYGLENNTGRGYPLRLEKYMGRVEYYDSNENVSIKGKIKYLGRTSFTYFSSTENEAFKGKIKTMNTIPFDYYAAYENEALRGRIKSAGQETFSFYSSYDNEAYKGKLKSVGNSVITYYASFDDKAFRGKVKTIDRFPYTYYSSYDNRDYQGSMKSGYPIQFINGINYYIRY